jgi:PAS domain S-box-containing protein
MFWHITGKTLTNMGKTILLVEDEVLIAVDRAEFLERNGYLVTTAINGKQAIEKVNSGARIDLILMDINLGKGMDGTQAAEVILKEHDIPVVFLSNYTEAEVVKKTDKVRSYGYVVKNSGDTVLLTSIKMAFRLYESQKELKEREVKLQIALDEKERIEKQLLQEQDNFIKIFSAAPVGLLLLDENSIVSKSNKAVSKLVLRDPAEIIGKRAGGGLGCIHSMETPDGCGFSESCPDCVLRKSVEDVLKDGTSVHGALVNPTLLIDGEYQEHWLVVSAEPVDLNGTRNVIVAVEDISDKKRIQSALDESQHFVRRILDATPNLIYTYDLKEKKNTYTNREVLDFLGYTPEHIKKMGASLFASILHPDDAGKVDGHHSKFHSSEETEVLEVEYRMKRADGQWRWLRSRDVLFSRDEYGKARQILGSAEDITERKRMEEALKHALNEKDVLLQELQHRVKNTLAIISGLIGLEVNRTTEDHVKNVLQSMRDRIASLAKLYEMLYRSGMDMNEIRLNEYIKEIATSLLNSYKPEKEQISLQLDLKEMYIDVRRAIPVGLIVNEIMTNSIKHAFNSDHEGYIRVGLVNSDGRVIIDVEDNGNRLQLQSYPDGSKSLGLVLVKILTEQISGTLESNIDKGTRFRITFPV